MSAQPNDVALPLRSHTILGICEGIGEDFGFNPVWLRVPFAATVLVSPMWSIVAYLTLGVVVLASRMLFPRPKLSSSAPAVQEPGMEAPANEERELAKAA